jgi:hypothetical protein
LPKGTIQHPVIELATGFARRNGHFNPPIIFVAVAGCVTRSGPPVYFVDIVVRNHLDEHIDASVLIRHSNGAVTCKMCSIASSPTLNVRVIRTQAEWVTGIDWIAPSKSIEIDTAREAERIFLCESTGRNIV